MPVFFALALGVTSGTNCHEVRRGIVEFVAIHVVNMEKLTGFWKLHFTNPTSIVISFANVVGNSFPGWCITPFGNTALPGWIAGALHRTVEDKCLASRASFYSKLPHKFADCRLIYADFVRDVLNRTMLVYIFTTQPIRMFVGRINAVMTFYVSIPSVLAAVPCNSITTTTFAQRRGIIRNILDWLTSFPVGMGLNIIPNWDVVSLENVLDRRWRYIKFFANRLRSCPTTISGRSCVKKYDFAFNVRRNSFHILVLGGGIA